MSRSRHLQKLFKYLCNYKVESRKLQPTSVLAPRIALPTTYSSVAWYLAKYQVVAKAALHLQLLG